MGINIAIIFYGLSTCSGCGTKLIVNNFVIANHFSASDRTIEGKFYSTCDQKTLIVFVILYFN